MQDEKRTKISPPKEVAYIAVMCALLIGGQYIFSFVAGVEIVTLLMVCFSFVFGIRRGVICAVAFSLLRCIIYGFSPTAVILYLIYYPLLALAFGGLGKIRKSTFDNYPVYFVVIVNVLLAGVAAVCAVCYFCDLINISRLWKVTLHIFLWVIFSLCIALCIVFDSLYIAKKVFKKNTSQILKLILITSIAVVFTICFTLLDDIIAPLFLGYTKGAAMTYFYASFTAMLPQVICTIVSITTLFIPLTAALNKTAKL